MILFATESELELAQASDKINSLIIRLEETAKALESKALKNEADIVAMHLHKLRTPEYRKNAKRNPEFANRIIDAFVKDFDE